MSEKPTTQTAVIYYANGNIAVVHLTHPVDEINHIDIYRQEGRNGNGVLEGSYLMMPVRSTQEV